MAESQQQSSTTEPQHGRGIKLSDLKPKEFVELISRTGFSWPSGAQESFINAMYRGEIESKTIQNISIAEYRKQLEHLPTEQLIAKVRQSHATWKNEAAKESFEVLEKRLESEKFETNYKLARKGSFLRKANAPIVEYFLAQGSDDKERAVRINLFRDPEFKDFQKKILDKAHRINRSDDLNNVRKTFEDPTEYRKLKDPQEISLSREIVKSFPKLPRRLGQLDGARAVIERGNKGSIDVPISMRERLDKAKDLSSFISKNYGFHVKSDEDLLELISVEEKTSKILKDPRTVQAWNYIKKNYPDSLSEFTFKSFVTDGSGFAARVGGYLQDEKADLKRLDLALGKLGLNVGQLKLGFLEDESEVDKFIKSTRRKNENGIEWHLKSIEKAALVPGMPEYFKTNFSKIDRLGMPTLYDVIKFIDAFKLSGKNELLNSKLKQIGPSFPRLSEDSEAIIKERLDFIDAFSDAKLPGVKLTHSDSLVNWKNYYFKSVEKPIEFLKSKEALELARALTELWKKETPLADFLAIAASPNALKFYLDPANAERFHSINANYKIVELLISTPSEVRPGAKPPYYEPPEQKYVASEAPLESPEFARKLKSNFPEIFKDTIRDDLLLPVAKFVSNDKNFESRIEHLKNRFNLPVGKLISAYLISIESEKDHSKEVLNLFDSLQKVEAFAEEKDSALLRYSTAVTFSHLPSLPATLVRLRELEFNISSEAEIKYIEKTILKNPKFVAQLSDPDFKVFYEGAVKTLLSDKRKLSDLPEMMELYSETSPEDRKQIGSEKFREATTFIRRHLSISKLDSSTIIPILKTLPSFDKKRIDNLVHELEKSGIQVGGSDYSLLVRMSQNDEVRKEALDRDSLLKSVGKLMERPPAFRTLIDGVSLLTGELEENKKDLASVISIRDSVLKEMDKGIEAEKKKGRNPEGQIKLKAAYLKDFENDKLVKLDKYLKEQIVKAASSYNERPPLESFDTLELYKSDLIGKALNNPINQALLGDMLIRDIENKNTEFGGVVTLNRGGVSFKLEASLSDFDGAFSSNKNSFFPGGIATFHMHARTINERAKAGPSGSRDAHSGDMYVYSANRVTGMVFTPLGHPIRPDGTEDKTMVLVDADICFPRKKGVETLDMGVFEIPYKKLSNSEVEKLTNQTGLISRSVSHSTRQ